MRRRIEALAERIEEFLSEDHHDALVLDADAGASGLIAAALDCNEQRGSLDLSLPCFERFEDAGAFCRAALGQLDALGQLAGLSGRTATISAAPLAQLVDRLVDVSRGLARCGDVRLAVWLCPAEITDREAYVAVVVALAAAARRCEPPLRIAAREVDRAGSLRAALQRATIPTLELSVDLSPEAIRDGLAEDAHDASVDPRQRAAAALTLAMSDVAAGRVDAALESLARLADHHHARGEVVERALCFALAGSALARRGELDEARARLAQGRALAVEARSAPTVLFAVMTAGEVALTAGDPRDADQQFDCAARVAAALRRPSAVAHALVGRGRARLALEEPRLALEAFSTAAVLAREAAVPEVEREALTRVAQLYRDARMTRELGRVEARLGALPSPEHAHR